MQNSEFGMNTERKQQRLRAADTEEAKAVKLVAEKGCKAFVAADVFRKQNAGINTVESLLMRVIYKAKYAKKK